MLLICFNLPSDILNTVQKTTSTMGSTDELTKARSVKKKLALGEEDSDSTSNSKPVSGTTSPDCLEHGIDDDLKPLSGAEAKSSGSDTESELDTSSKQSEEIQGIPVQGARFRGDSESSENGKRSSSEKSER